MLGVSVCLSVWCVCVSGPPCLQPVVLETLLGQWRNEERTEDTGRYRKSGIGWAAYSLSTHECAATRRPGTLYFVCVREIVCSAYVSTHTYLWDYLCTHT